VDHCRKSIRLRGYDYAGAGEYFVTICTSDHAHLFGEIEDDTMQENPFGVIGGECWNELPRHYPTVLLDAFVVMPNHIHGIVVIMNDAARHAQPSSLEGVSAVAGLRPATTAKRYPLSEIVRALKSFSARRINELRKTPGCHVWQRNYFEHIIRNEEALRRIREYIHTNPIRWSDDAEISELSRIDNLGEVF
jgi:putative transposase